MWAANDWEELFDYAVARLALRVKIAKQDASEIQRWLGIWNLDLAWRLACVAMWIYLSEDGMEQSSASVHYAYRNSTPPCRRSNSMWRRRGAVLLQSVTIR